MKTIAIVLTLSLMPAVALADGSPDPLPPMPVISGARCDAATKLAQCNGYLGETEKQRDLCIGQLAECRNVSVDTVKDEIINGKKPVVVTTAPPPKKATKPTAPKAPKPPAPVAKNGRDGKDGHDGTNGVDGLNGHDGLNGQDGQNGRDGRDGKEGQDGSAIFQLIGIGGRVTAFKVPAGWTKGLFATVETSLRLAENVNLTLSGGWAPGKQQAAFGQFMLDLYPFKGARWLGLGVGGQAQYLDIDSRNYAKYQMLAGAPAIVIRSTSTTFPLKFRFEAGAVIGVQGHRGNWESTFGPNVALTVGPNF